MGPASERKMRDAAEKENGAPFLFVCWRILGGVGAAGLGRRPGTSLGEETEMLQEAVLLPAQVIRSRCVAGVR